MLKKIVVICVEDVAIEIIVADIPGVVHSHLGRLLSLFLYHNINFI